MTDQLKDVVAYLIKNYPETMLRELSNARLTKMVYLADWHSCLRGKGQITDIDWYFDNYGPFVWDIQKTATENDGIFEIHETSNMYGNKKRLFSLKGDPDIEISGSAKKSLDHILEVSSKLYWENFIKLVYSTYPVASSERYTQLNLIEKAEEYKKVRG
jgi:hypothetical protein